MATPYQETFLSIPDENIQEVYVVYQDQLVLTSVYNWLYLGQHNISTTPPQSDLSQHMLNLQLESFTGVMEGANIANFVAIKLPDSPANISYNTQGVLDELPLDVSNNMD
ncbi:hypothetical protein DSO57_1019182 [Entomophthora muscae]|uniref:Uncharacterized protein n=1 Tax=Entomophthora muscae TaxID=34485 RepID=A0ACC2TRP7_9FUNG|nr:hypothetical protein DSO57_1019182 [Entomophthora muscae]